MSEVTVLDIPLQNSLTPRVGTYSNEGRQDATFEYDNELEEYSLTCSNTDSTGYYTYTFEPIANTEYTIISCDIKIINNTGHKDIISFNDGGEYPWFAIQKYYSSIDLRRQTGATASNNGANAIASQVRNQWIHVDVKYTVGTVNNTLVSVFEFFVNGNLTSTIRDTNTTTNKDYTIHKVTLLGTESANSSCLNVLLKNVKIKIKASGDNYILLNSSNEQLKAYESIPQSYNAILKGTINFEHLLTTEAVQNDNQYYTYTFPLDNAVNKSIMFLCNARNTPLNTDHNVVYDSAFNSYVLQPKYNSYSFNLFPVEFDTLGTDNTKMVCIDYPICITNWNGNTKFFLMSLGGIDPANNGTSNALRLMCTNNCAIVDEFGNNPMSTNNHISNNLSIELNTIYRITIFAKVIPLNNELRVKVFINSTLIYSGISQLNSFSISNFDCCFFYKQWLSNSCLVKIGKINIYNGYPNSWFKLLNAKHNNKFYYLLCSSTGLYPSKLRAKIDGTTYPILLKHDEDNTSE